MESTLREILRVIEPTPADRQTRRLILQELQIAVQSVDSLRGASVEPFGSFLSELFTRWGDLDVSIEFSKGSYISSFGKKHTQDVLRAVMTSMRQRGGWNRIQFILNARVPILVAKSKLENISCDISVNNLKAQMKSKLFLWISEIDPRFRDLVLLVKEWAKAHNINNSKSGSFNSYTLSLLVVFHFQTCSPAILPPLQEIYPETLTDDLKGLRDDAEKHIETDCINKIRRFQSNKRRALNNSSLSELLTSFFGKFSDISSKALELGISTYSGKWEAVENNMGWLPKTYTLLVEDPFDRPENSARGVSRRNLERISEAFAMSRDRLISASYRSPLAIESSLLATLVRPHMLHLMRNPGHNFNRHQATHPQHFMAESSHSQSRRKYKGPSKPTGPSAHQLVHSSSREYNGLPNQTGPYVQHLVHSAPRVQQGLMSVPSSSSSRVRRHVGKSVPSQVQAPVQKMNKEKTQTNRQWRPRNSEMQTSDKFVI